MSCSLLSSRGLAGAGPRGVFTSRRAPSRTRLSVSAKWVLTPIGSGDCSHLEAAVALPGQITLAPKLVFGREASASVNTVLAVPTVSGTHAMIDMVGTDYYLTDLASTNGTFLDGEELDAGKPVKLSLGCEIVFGDEFVAKFVVQDSAN